MVVMVEEDEKEKRKNARERIERKVNKRKSVGIEKVALLLLLLFGIRGIDLFVVSVSCLSVMCFLCTLSLLYNSETEFVGFRMK